MGKKGLKAGQFQTSSGRWGAVRDALELHYFAYHASHFWEEIFNYLVQAPLLAQSWWRVYQAQLSLFHSTIPLSHKQSLYSKNFDDFITCDLQIVLITGRHRFDISSKEAVFSGRDQ